MVRSLNPEKRQALLNSALKLFAANGVEHTSTAEIAREAGTAAGTLFLYFPTKLDLVSELTLQIARRQTESIQALLEPSFNARQSFWAIWSGSLGWFRQHPEAYRFIQQARSPEWVSPAALQESERLFSFYYEAIRKGLAEGSILPYPAELIGEYLYKSITAVMDLVQRQTDAAQQEAYITQGFEIFWNGIKADLERP